MKFRVFMKTCDTVKDAIEALAEIKTKELPPGYHRDDTRELIKVKAGAAVDTFMRRRENLLIEFDTDTNSARVIPRTEW